MKIQQPILDLGFTIGSEIGGVYIFNRQVGDNVVGFIETLMINTHDNTYVFYKKWGGKQVALAISFDLHTAITKTLFNLGVWR